MSTFHFSPTILPADHESDNVNRRVWDLAFVNKIQDKATGGQPRNLYFNFSSGFLRWGDSDPFLITQINPECRRNVLMPHVLLRCTRIASMVPAKIVAERLGVSKTTILLWETGVHGNPRDRQFETALNTIVQLKKVYQ